MLILFIYVLSFSICQFIIHFKITYFVSVTHDNTDKTIILFCLSDGFHIRISNVGQSNFKAIFG